MNPQYKARRPITGAAVRGTHARVSIVCGCRFPPKGPPQLPLRQGGSEERGNARRADLENEVAHVGGVSSARPPLIHQRQHQLHLTRLQQNRSLSKLEYLSRAIQKSAG